jgi:hypothetical protein
MRAPGRFVDAVKCVVARTRTAQLHEIPTFQTKLSQYCHRCENYTRKPLSQRFHCCPHCGLGSDGLIQRDLYSAWLASVLDPIRLSFPSRGQLGIRLPKHGGVLVGRAGLDPRTCECAGLPAALRYPRSWSVSARTFCRSTPRAGCLLGGVGSGAGGARTPVINHRESQLPLP